MTGFFRWIKSSARTAVRAMLRPVFRFIFRVTLHQPAGFQWGGRQLLVANHESYLDGLLIGLFLPIDPVFVVHTGVMQNRAFRLMLSLVDTVAVDPLRPIGMKTVLRALQNNRPVVIFPEGRISDTGGLMKVYDGPAMLAARSAAEVVPVRLDGLKRSYFSRMSAVQPKFWRPSVSLTVLPPTTFALPEAPTARLRRQRASEALRALMQHMLFAARPAQSLWSAYLAAEATFGRRRPMIEDIKAEVIRYGRLTTMALAFGRWGARGTAAGEAVGVLLPNLAVTAGVLLGLSAAGRVPAMLNYTAGADGLRTAARACPLRVVITSRVFAEKANLTALLNDWPGVEVRYLEDMRRTFGLADRWWVLQARRSPLTALSPVADPDSAAVILFTSGSEGRPKGVVLSHRAILANIAQIQSVFDLTPADKVLNVLPVFHAFGLTGGLLLPLLAGTRVFLHISPLQYKLVPEIAYDRNCTLLFGTNSFLANYGKFAHPYDFHKLRYVIAGAEKLSESVRSLWFEKFGLRIFEGYGVTETAPVLAVNTPMAYRSGTVGQFLPGIEHRLLPVPGIEEGGLLCVRGPNVMSGYLRDEAPGRLDAPSVPELGAGWYNTGDIVSLDAEGFVTIRGRLKRFAKIAGEMVSLETVEAMARAAAPYATHAATSLPEAQRGEQLVLLTTEPSLNRSMLLEAARRLGFSELAVPRQIIVVDTIPLLGTGKVDYPGVRTEAARRLGQMD
ncbi:AMP-binding protein [Halothiobacillus sp. DCM-1]|uniref:AMP-binding protein n=1 Tax=Halothiobacillus sp. DCM-1 TaxID=3112558 RepID=UPI003244A61F